MKDIYKNETKQAETDIIHSSLYQFTKKKLSSLESYKSYKFLINDFYKSMERKGSDSISQDF